MPERARLLSHSVRARSSFLQTSLKSLSLLGNDRKLIAVYTSTQIIEALVWLGIGLQNHQRASPSMRQWRTVLQGPSVFSREDPRPLKYPDTRTKKFSPTERTTHNCENYQVKTGVSHN